MMGPGRVRWKPKARTTSAPEVKPKASPTQRPKCWRHSEQWTSGQVSRSRAGPHLSSWPFSTSSTARSMPGSCSKTHEQRISCGSCREPSQPPKTVCPTVVAPSCHNPHRPPKPMQGAPAPGCGGEPRRRLLHERGEEVVQVLHEHDHRPEPTPMRCREVAMGLR